MRKHNTITDGYFYIPGEDLRLCYVKNKDGREIDFLVVRSGIPELMLEVKWRDDTISSNFKLFKKFMPDAHKIQLVTDLKREKTYPGGTEIKSRRRAEKKPNTLVFLSQVRDFLRVHQSFWCVFCLCVFGRIVLLAFNPCRGKKDIGHIASQKQGNGIHS